MSDTSDDLPERLDESGTETERFLLRAGQTDALPRGLAERILAARLSAAGVAETGAPQPKKRRLSRAGAALVFGAFAAAAALLAFWTLRQKPAELPHAELPGEPPVTERGAPKSTAGAPAPSTPALLAPSSLCTVRVVADGSAPLIDDMEDKNGRILQNEGRDGLWFVNNDGSGTQLPAAGETWRPERLTRKGSAGHFALHTKGNAFSKWGAAAGALFVESGCYDASRYEGVRFWAKGKGRIKAALQTFDVVPRAEGGFCDADCYGNHYRRIELDPKGREYTVRFDQLTQHDFGVRVAFDASRLRAFLITVDAVDTPFDFWLDDVRFVASTP
jgi:hypothetical protein